MRGFVETDDGGGCLPLLLRPQDRREPYRPNVPDGIDQRATCFRIKPPKRQRCGSCSCRIRLDEMEARLDQQHPHLHLQQVPDPSHWRRPHECEENTHIQTRNRFLQVVQPVAVDFAGGQLATRRLPVVFLLVGRNIVAKARSRSAQVLAHIQAECPARHANRTPPNCS